MLLGFLELEQEQDGAVWRGRVGCVLWQAGPEEGQQRQGGLPGRCGTFYTVGGQGGKSEHGAGAGREQ